MCWKRNSDDISYINCQGLSKSFLALTKKTVHKYDKPGEVLEAMRHTIRQSIKLLHTRYVVDFMRELIKARIGTSSVESQCETICSTLPWRRKLTMVNRVMKRKMDDARRCLCETQYVNTVEWRKNKPIIVQAGVLNEYQIIWDLEKKQVETELK